MTNLSALLPAIRQAVALCQRIQADFLSASTKGDDSPVTLADYGTQALISRALAIHFPHDAIIAEEGGSAFAALVPADEQALLASLLSETLAEPVSPAQIIAWLDHGTDRADDGQTWVIDPIDGTEGFISRRHYAICVGVMNAYQPAGAVLAIPRSPLHVDGSLVYTHNNAVYAEGIMDGVPQVCRVSTRSNAAELRFLQSHRTRDEEALLFDAILTQTSLTNAQREIYDSALKYGMVAAGYGDIFMRAPRRPVPEPQKIWDHLSGIALVLAAGGTVTDFEGAPIDFSRGTVLPHASFIASSGVYHDALVQAAQAALAAMDA